MTRDERTFRIWLAGFFDGEGSIGIYHTFQKGRHQWEPKLTLYQKDESIIRLVCERLGGYVHKCGAKGNQAWCVAWTWRKARKVAEYLYPFLRVKKEQCRAFLDALDQWENHQGEKDLTHVLVAKRTNLANSVNGFNAKPIPSQAVEAVEEADETEGVTVIDEAREGKR